MKYAAAVLVVVGGLLVFLQSVSAEIRVCRSALEGLSRGQAWAQGRVDWNRLSAMGMNVGATYASLPNDRERARYRQAFITQFSKGFKGTGASARDFINWRVVERETDRIVVAADYPGKGKTLLMTITARGKQRVESIQWATAEDAE